MKISKKTRRNVTKALLALLVCCAFWAPLCAYVMTREVGVSMVVLAVSVAIMLASGKVCSLIDE